MITPAVFVGFKKFSFKTMMRKWRVQTNPTRRLLMHDVLIALAFIGMVVAPAIVAAKAGGTESRID